MSGGHSINPGFSSTKGIHIYTGRFSQVTYDASSGTAVIGSGLIWDTVYEKLQSYDVSVLGGRVPEVSVYHNCFSRRVLNTTMEQIGVGGFVLGGGESPKAFCCHVH